MIFPAQVVNNKSSIWKKKIANISNILFDMFTTLYTYIKKPN